jgi:Flp pilus assembly pilin Flp
MTTLAILATTAVVVLTVLWMGRTFAHVRAEDRLAMRAARVALRTRCDRGSVSTEYALAIAALALALAGWLGAAEAAVEYVWPQVACTLDDICMGR